MRSRGALSRMRPGLVNARIEGRWRSHQRLERHGPGHIRQFRHAQPAGHRQRTHGRHRLGPVEQRQPLFSSQRQRLQACPPQRFAPGQPLAFVERLTLANNHERQVSQRSQIAARTNRPLFRNHRMHTRIQLRDQQFHQIGPASAESLGQHIGAQQQHGARLAFGKWMAHPARMAAHQVGLQLRQAAVGNAHIRQLSKPRVDPVNRLPLGQYPFDQFPAGQDTL